MNKKSWWKSQKQIDFERDVRRRLCVAIEATITAGSNDPVYLHEMGISRVDIKKDGKKIIVYLSRPGLFIGKKGKRLDAIQEEMNFMMGHPVEIDIVEFDPFW